MKNEGGNRRQLTFYNNAVQKPKFCPDVDVFDGFIFQKDNEGDEFFQLHSYGTLFLSLFLFYILFYCISPFFLLFISFFFLDVRTGDIKLLTDGKSKNENVLWAKSGDKFLYSSTQV